MSSALYIMTQLDDKILGKRKMTDGKQNQSNQLKEAQNSKKLCDTCAKYGQCTDAETLSCQQNDYFKWSAKAYAKAASKMTD